MPLLTEGALAAAAGGVALTDGAALALRDHHVVAVQQLIALDLVTQHLAIVAHTDPAWLWLPDVPVGVDLAVRRAAHVISWSRHKLILSVWQSVVFPNLCLAPCMFAKQACFGLGPL